MFCVDVDVFSPSWKSVAVGLILFGLAALLFWFAGDLAPEYAPRYRAMTIADKEYHWVSAKAINESGQIAGTVELRSWNVCGLWDPEKGTTLVGPISNKWGSTEFYETFPQELNERGEVLGYGSIVKGTVSFHGFPDGSYHEISTSGYTGLNQATDLNSEGIVSGYIIDPTGYSAVILDARKNIRRLPVKQNSYAVAVNDKNLVCGWENSAFFICDGSTVTTYKNVPSGSHISDFSNLSLVCGHITVERGLFPNEVASGFVWSPTDGIVIDSASMERQSTILAINDAGDAVGAIYPFKSSLSQMKDGFQLVIQGMPLGYVPPDPQLKFAEAVLWQDGEAIPLQDLVLPDSPFDRLMFANDINDHGTIAGSGEINGRPSAFVLEPLVEP